MRKGMWSAAALVLLSGAAAFVLGMPGVKAAETVTMGSSSEPNAFKFFPAEITVPVGTTVVWRNLSDIPHDATARNNSFASPQLTKGQDFSFTFNAPGEIPYYCSVSGHEDAGMIGVVKVTGAGTPSPPPTTPTTAATTTTTAKPVPGQPATTTTTAKGAAGATSSTTTTAAAGNGATTTTLAPGVTPTSGPDVANETTTTTAAAGGGGEQAAADDHAGEGAAKKEKKKNSPIGIAFASVSTVLLAAIAGKLLASKP
jgi:plastocyanin